MAAENSTDGNETAVKGSFKSIEIIPNGDIRLLLDQGSLRVSRTVLCLSSPVFSAMLGTESKFKEVNSDNVDEFGIQEVRLGDDLLDVMAILMNVIHLQNEAVPTGMSFRLLGQIAVICDKYDLRRSILPWAEWWSQPHRNSVDTNGFEAWLFISKTFHDPYMFSRITRHMILTSRLQDSAFDPSSLNGRVSNTIIAAIQQERAAAMDAIMNSIRDLSRQLFDKSTPVCKMKSKQNKCDVIHIGCLSNSFRFLHDPSSKDKECSINEMVHRVRDMQKIGGELVTDRTAATPREDHAGCSLSKLLTPKVTAIVASIGGLKLPQGG